MQFGKFHLEKNSRLIAFHSSGDDGALTNSSLSTAHIASHVSFIAEQTVDFPSRKLNESDTCKQIMFYVHAWKSYAGCSPGSFHLPGIAKWGQAFQMVIPQLSNCSDIFGVEEVDQPI